MKYLILTNRSEYQLCRYEVEAASPEEAEQMLDHSAECVSSEIVHAEEVISEISPLPDPEPQTES
jgi:hypothetical protein